MGVATDAAALASGPPLSGLGCMCGAGDQLEAERLRLMSHSRSIIERAECLAVREEELDRRAIAVQASAEALLDSEYDFEARCSDAEVQRLDAERMLCEVVDRESSAQATEAELQTQEAKLAELEAEAARGEAALADNELVLLEAQNAAEADLQRERDRSVALETKAAALDRECESCSCALRQAAAEDAELSGDEALLTEIETQVAPIRHGLNTRERALIAKEVEIRAWEADCDEREARLFPEYQHSFEALACAQERMRELRFREEESERQRSRLLQRQRELGGAEIRLSGFEGALRQRDSGKESLPRGLEEDEAECRGRLARLRSADAVWAERVRAQQAKVQNLEARLAELEALRFGPGRDNSSADMCGQPLGSKLTAKLGGASGAPVRVARQGAPLF